MRCAADGKAPSKALSKSKSRSPVASSAAASPAGSAPADSNAEAEEEVAESAEVSLQDCASQPAMARSGFAGCLFSSAVTANSSLTAFWSSQSQGQRGGCSVRSDELCSGRCCLS